MFMELFVHLVKGKKKLGKNSVTPPATWILVGSFVLLSSPSLVDILLFLFGCFLFCFVLFVFLLFLRAFRVYDVTYVKRSAVIKVKRRRVGENPEKK